MKKLIIMLALACFATLPAEAAVRLADSNERAGATVSENVSVIVLVRDASGKNIFASVRENIASSVLGLLAATGAQTQSLDFFKTNESNPAGTGENRLKALSPAEAMALTGADYALVLQLAAPIETLRDGTVYARQSVFHTLFSSEGKVVDSGGSSKIFDAPSANDSLREIRVCEVAEEVAENLVKKIADGKIVLRKTPPAQLGEAEVVAVVESMTFPQVVENKDGTFSVAETQASVALPGIELKIGGLDYPLATDGSPTKLKLPIGRALFVSATHRDIDPLNRTVKLEKSGEKIVLPITLSKATRERWKKDAAEISDMLGKQKITAAEAERIRAIAKFWENSGMKISDDTTRTISREIKNEIKQIEETK